MKKKIIISFLFLFLLFLTGIFATLHIIEKTTANLTSLLLLHKVEVIRQELVISVQTVQSNLYTTGTSFGKELDLIVDNVLRLRKKAGTCTDCHHEADVEREILHLQELTEQYKEALSYFITSTADPQRIQRLQSLAADIGDRIIEQSQLMAMTANDTLRRKTTTAMVEVSESKKILKATLVIAFFLGVLISVYFIRSITGPIAELLGATRIITSGNLQYRIKKKLKNEFGELAGSFNEMSTSLQEQYNKLQETERLAVVGELAAGMFHEIKNPMAGIKVSMEVLSHEAALDPEDKKILHLVISEIDRVTNLLQGLLDYARPPKPEMVSLSVEQVLESTIKSAQYVLQAHKSGLRKTSKKIIFVRDFSPGLPFVIADPCQLKQVFLNLILNAIDVVASLKDRQGVITIKTKNISDKYVQVSIADNGTGIDSQHLETMFKPFFTTKPSGTGLGLAISKRLIEQHKDARINAVNNPDGPGLVVIITLPTKPDNIDFEVDHVDFDISTDRLC